MVPFVFCGSTECLFELYSVLHRPVKIATQSEHEIGRVRVEVCARQAPKRLKPPIQSFSIEEKRSCGYLALAP